MRTIEDLQTRFNNKEKLNFLFFWGHTNNTVKINKTCFSQWFERSFVDNNSITYQSAEQYMMCQKALLFGDTVSYEKMLKSKTPKDVKVLGRGVKNFDNDTWNENKLKIVIDGNLLKFEQNSDLLEFLLSTNDKILVEASPYDTIWGIGMSESDNNVENPNKWKGENLLGIALMAVRDKHSNK